MLSKNRRQRLCQFLHLIRSLSTVEGEEYSHHAIQQFASILQGYDGILKSRFLGVIDDGVRQLLSEVNYPGMKILSFAFNGDEDNLYLPKNIIENSVCYTGTHDNDTLMGLIQNASEWDKNQLVNSVKRSLEEQRIDGQTDCDEGLALSIIKLGFFSKANTFIIPMQDILFYGSEYRINQPGKVSNRNWSIRLKNTDFNLKKAKKLMQLTKKSKRI